MALSVFIYVFLIFLVICSVKVFFSILGNNTLARENYTMLQNQFTEEINKQKSINQKLILVDALNNSLMKRIFKIISDLFIIQDGILKNQFE